MFGPLLALALLLSMAMPAWLKPPQSVYRGPAEAEIAQRRSVEFSNATWRFYDVGFGQCGGINVNSDFVVALNSHIRSEQYGSSIHSPHCFKQISMTYKGRSTVATIVDMCPTCHDKGLDLSRGLFEFFAPLSEEAIHGTWRYDD